MLLIILGAGLVLGSGIVLLIATSIHPELGWFKSQPIMTTYLTSGDVSISVIVATNTHSSRVKTDDIFKSLLFFCTF